MKKRLTKNAGIIGLGTAVSRVLGFIRDVLIARYFGTGPIAEAFVVAWRIPNMLRDLVGEGAANSALVPVLTAYHQKDKQQYQEAVSNLLNTFFVVLVIITGLGILFAPLLVRIFAPGMIGRPEVMDMTITLTRWVFPYIILIGLTAFCMGTLNAFHHFMLPSLGQPIFNLIEIICIIVLVRIYPYSSIPLVVGVLLGGVGQFGINIPGLYRYGIRLRALLDFSHEAVRKVVSLLLPRLAGTGVYQLSLIIGSALASLSMIVGQGAIPALYYANRLIQLPLGIFGVSLAQAALPTLSEQVLAQKHQHFRDTIAFSLGVTFLVSIPASVGLFVLAHPLIRILFQRGAFDAYSVQITSMAICYYSVGLFALGGIKILVNAFFALGDTKTPVKAAAISLVVNTLLGVLLIWPMKTGGIALATSVAGIVNFCILFYKLQQRIGDIGLRALGKSFVKICAASCGMGIITYSVVYHWLNISAHVTTYMHMIQFAGVIMVSGIVYVILCVFFHVQEVKGALQWILKKK